MIMKTTASVVVRPTPSAPPRVRKPMCSEMIGIRKPKAAPLTSE